MRLRLVVIQYLCSLTQGSSVLFKCGDADRGGERYHRHVVVSFIADGRMSICWMVVANLFLLRAPLQVLVNGTLGKVSQVDFKVDEKPRVDFDRLGHVLFSALRAENYLLFHGKTQFCSLLCI